MQFHFEPRRLLKRLLTWRASAAALLFMSCNPALWAHSHEQHNWEPDTFKIVCEDPDGCSLSPELRTTVTDLLSGVVNDIKDLGFAPPQYWQERVTDDEGAYMEIYEEGAGIASASLQCPEDSSSFTKLWIGSRITDYLEREYLLYYFMAHEVFHLIQYSRPFYDRSRCAPIPGWLMEGMSTAVALEAMRNRYPGVAPSNRDDREARNFAGLRQYNKPLAHRRLHPNHDGEEIWTGEYDQYRTASFWRHLADAHFRKKYTYLDTFMSREGWHQDWVGWLRNNVELETGVDFGMVFGGFLADYAGWGDAGYPGEFFGRQHWLKDAFGGCQTVYLDKTDAADYVDVEFQPLSGRCIEVRVAGLGESGISAQESATVQIAAVIQNGPASDRNGLHLGIAASNDKKDFHCAREVQRRGKQGLGRCLRVPDDGKIRIDGVEQDARVWNVFPQELGHRKGELTNLYAVSYTPIGVGSEDTRYGGKAPVSARFYFVLDVAKLEVPPTAGQTGDSSAKAVGSFAEGADPQSTLPKQDEQGRPAVSYAMPESLRPSLPPVPQTATALVPGRLSAITIAERVFDEPGNDEPLSSLVLMPIRAVSGGDYEPHALSVGETGEFPINIAANLAGQPAGAAPAPGLLIVEEFSDLVFRARFSGTVCRHKDLRPQQSCANPVPVSGQIVKAFAGSRLPGRFMKIERTPGTEIYRKANEAAMAGLAIPAASPSPGPGGSASAAGSGTIETCACTCEERDAMLERAEQLKERHDTGSEVGTDEIFALGRCNSVCQAEYLVCAMQQGEREREEKEAQRQAELEEASSGCDCSCAAIKNMQSNTEAILRRMQAGDPNAMQELQQAGICAAACQDAMQRCQ